MGIRAVLNIHSLTHFGCICLGCGSPAAHLYNDTSRCVCATRLCVCVCLFFITRGNGTMCTDTRVEHSSKASVSLSKQQQIQGLSEVSEAIRTNVEAL